MNTARHFLDLIDVPAADLRQMIEAARAMKAKGPQGARPLAGKTLAMIFERPSTRTRVSFEVGMRELGGDAIMLTAEEMQLGRGETLADTARVLSRYVDAILIRMLDPEALAELARYATVPVINGLTRRSHPCLLRRGVRCRPPRQRRSESGTDLHRRPAPLGVDTAGADPGQPPAGGRDHGAAEHHQHGGSVR